MAIFYPLYVRRSDGRTATIGKGRKTELNKPSEDQLNQKPDKHGISDYYREVQPEEVKHLDWRRKLGGMLAREMEWKDKDTDKAGSDNAYILAAFPENYRLYEHVKRTEKDGKTELKSKTHAAGGNDRQDAYLYGHPSGRRKRYRSPVDFFPHLLWLCTDESGDADNCSCRVCCPDDLDSAIPSAKIKMERSTKQEESKPFLQTQGTGRPHQDIPLMPGPYKGSATLAKPLPSPSPVKPTPTPLPRCKYEDQQIDRQYSQFTYRPGEMAWFKRGQTWGLGVVLRRWTTSHNAHFYSVQALTPPSGHLPAVTKIAELDLRPWLAWSVPRYTQNDLNLLQEPMKFETADWAGMAQGRYRNGSVEVDGSILAAKAIDQTYTPFGLTETTEPEPGVTDKYYDGVFFGAEKIWVGDPIRLVNDQRPDIMVVHFVIERSKHIAAMGQRIMQTVLYFIGDIYTLTSVPHPDPAKLSPAAPNNNPELPSCLTTDLNVRNNSSIRVRQTAHYWKLISVQSRVGYSDVKGRWYEASLLLPVLRSQPEYEAMQANGEIQEATFFMNSRGDCVNSNRDDATLVKLPKQNIRKETRVEAFGRAVPPGTQAYDGLEPPTPENLDPSLHRAQTSAGDMEIDPVFQRVDNLDQQQQGGDDGLNVDDFMNLEEINEHTDIPGFEQDYSHQMSNGGGGFY